VLTRGRGAGRLGIRDQGSGIRDQGSGIRDQGSGIRVARHERHDESTARERHIEPATGERDIEPAADDNAARWWSERHRSERCRGRRFDDTDYVGHASRSRNERNCDWYERTNVRRSRIDRAGSQRFEQAASRRTLAAYGE
jgi:hypothetical protein